MKKVLIFLVLISTAWMVKLSYELFMMRSLQDENTQHLRQLETQNASLNDQLIALKRQSLSQSRDLSQPIPSDSNTAVVSAGSGGLKLLSHQLDLAEFALNQHQYTKAMQTLQQLELQVADYTLSPALIESLQVALKKDQQMLKQLNEKQQIQLNKVADVLSQLDREITQEIAAQYQQGAEQESQGFWSKWIKIEAVSTPSQYLMQRGIVLKEAQLELLMAQNALQQGQTLVFQHAIDGVIQDLKKLPDARTQQWIQQLSQLKTASLPSVPVLSTRILSGE